jgi:hypothetical protein
MSICGDLINSAIKSGTFLNRIITGDKTVFSIRSTTEVTNGHLEITIIARKLETVTGQIKRQGNA